LRSVHDHSNPGERTAVGVDVGATLTKCALREGDGPPRFTVLGSDSLDPVARWVVEAAPDSIGLAGCGAPTLARLLSLDTAPVSEFDAWRSGAAALLGPGVANRYLLVSVGTGTSMMLVDGATSNRLGGTALGGGTLLGLGRALLGTDDFEALCEQAARGDRWQVDLSLADIYPSPDESPLPVDLSASLFARLGRPGSGPFAPEDVAAALMALVGENVAIIARTLAAAARVERLIFCGSTLRGNPALRGVIEKIVGLTGRPPEFLENGEYVGALGALLVAASARP
jgi:type II pantothenate kinase